VQEEERKRNLEKRGESVFANILSEKESDLAKGEILAMEHGFWLGGKRRTQGTKRERPIQKAGRKGESPV